MDKDLYLKQLSNVIEEFRELEKKSIYDDLSDLKQEYLSSLMTKTKAAISRITGKKSEYYNDVLSILDSNAHDGIKLRAVIGAAIALHSDVQEDYLNSFSEIIHANVFSDFIEMAVYLNSEGYKEAAAVIIGSTLEAHLKKLCTKNDVDVTRENNKGETMRKKADVLNTDLARVDVYNKIVQQQITAWLSIRNHAAHGEHPEYSADQVTLMIQGIGQFIVTTPA